MPGANADPIRPKPVQLSSAAGSSQRPFSLMRSTRRSTASAFGNVEFHRRLADVEVDLAGRAADVAEIGVGHFAGAVDDAAHDGDLHALEVVGRGLDAGGGGLEIEERAAAGGAGDVIGLENAAAGRLQDVVGEPERCAGSVLRPARGWRRRCRRRAARRCSWRR